ncbi:hypothetical protein DNTS_018913 [Danionella cerebrum]|uniref:Exonuclease domain-containing protein n=1 Tax=Danionella cerebrum TaxID=2873325 RepID=A0A553QL26_9TELE|nr:hypothetical protein DNTS_018913 [Danionella translucida]
MSQIMINAVCEPSKQERAKKSKGNYKHERFQRRRQFLQSKGFLKDKQNQWKKKKNKNNKYNGNYKAKPSAVFSQFTCNLPSTSIELTQKPTSSLPSFASSSQSDQTQRPVPGSYKYVALDCEMVGSGPKGCQSELGRCSVVSYDGDVIYDKFIKPCNPVTDFRTRWSGIKYKDLVNATPFNVARKEILKILAGKVVVGHAIRNDFKVLMYFHPREQTRDTSEIPLLNKKGGFPENQNISLKKLTKTILNKDIQKGKCGHSSVEDARATMELYKVVESDWEQTLASQTVGQSNEN